MHYYQFNIADYRKDTTHLSMLEHGAYRQLLDWHYLDQTPIPKETEVVFRRLSARTEEEQKAILIVLKELFILTDDGYIQHRVMREIEQYEAKADRARNNGKLGGRPQKTNEVIYVNQKNTDTKANQEPITNNHKPLTTIKPKPSREIALDDGFNEFWNIYPKKVGKTDAQKKWISKKPNIDFVLQALRWQAQSEQWNKENGAFIPNPSTYINQERWNDEQPKLRAVF